MNEEFIKATMRWYEFVSKDHHKDRDCHWLVGKETQYSYGEKAEGGMWFVRHDGYITEFDEYGDSEAEVMKKAIDFIDDFISKDLSQRIYNNLPIDKMKACNCTRNKLLKLGWKPKEVLHAKGCPKRK